MSDSEHSLHFEYSSESDVFDEGSSLSFNDGFIPRELNGQQSESETKEKNDDIQIEIPSININLDLLPLVQSGYSLKPDMLNGWRPSLTAAGCPIPLIFQIETLRIRKQLNGFPYPIIFHGSRPKNSLVMHRLFCQMGRSTYKFIFPVDNNYEALLRACGLEEEEEDQEDVRPFVGMSPNVTPNELMFDSTFESGNLDMVVKLDNNEYDLFMRVDSNTRGHHQWFYFSVSNPEEKTVRFNIRNFTKKTSLYQQGMKIQTWSKRKNKEKPQTGWVSSGTNINYYKTVFPDESGEAGPTWRRRKPYYTMSFTYDFEHPDDTVYFAYAIPYTFSQLSEFIEGLPRQSNSAQILTQDILCRSLSGVEIPLLTIHNSKSECENKKCMVVTGRVHPGETNGSWMMEGFLRFITGESPTAKYLRDHVVFKVIPMLNPDGVICGNYRTSLSGSDLNRKFLKPDRSLHPVVANMKKLLTELQRGPPSRSEVIAFLDFHGHSQKKGVFAYGGEAAINDDKYLQLRMLPKLIADQTDMFRYYSCRFKLQNSKRGSSRVVAWNEFRIMFSYTIEASLYGYLSKERVTTEFSEQSLQEMGQLIGSSLSELYKLKLEEEGKEKERELFQIQREIVNSSRLGYTPRSARSKKKKTKKKSFGNGGQSLLSAGGTDVSDAEDDDSRFSARRDGSRKGSSATPTHEDGKTSFTFLKSPSLQRTARGERMRNLYQDIQRIEEASKKETHMDPTEEDSDGSDSDDDEEDYSGKELGAIHNTIKKSIAQFAKYMGADSKKPNFMAGLTLSEAEQSQKKSRRVYATSTEHPLPDVNVESTLSQYFSKAEPNEETKKKRKSKRSFKTSISYRDSTKPRGAETNGVADSGSGSRNLALSSRLLAKSRGDKRSSVLSGDGDNSGGRKSDHKKDMSTGALLSINEKVAMKFAGKKAERPSTIATARVYKGQGRLKSTTMGSSLLSRRENSQRLQSAGNCSDMKKKLRSIAGINTRRDLNSSGTPTDGNGVKKLFTPSSETIESPKRYLFQKRLPSNQSICHTMDEDGKPLTVQSGQAKRIVSKQVTGKEANTAPKKVKKQKVLNLFGQEVTPTGISSSSTSALLSQRRAPSSVKNGTPSRNVISPLERFHTRDDQKERGGDSSDHITHFVSTHKMAPSHRRTESVGVLCRSCGKATTRRMECACSRKDPGDQATSNTLYTGPRERKLLGLTKHNLCLQPDVDDGETDGFKFSGPSTTKKNRDPQETEFVTQTIFKTDSMNDRGSFNRGAYPTKGTKRPTSKGKSRFISRLGQDQSSALDNTPSLSEHVKFLSQDSKKAPSNQNQWFSARGKEPLIQFINR